MGHTKFQHFCTDFNISTCVHQPLNLAAVTEMQTFPLCCFFFCSSEPHNKTTWCMHDQGVHLMLFERIFFCLSVSDCNRAYRQKKAPTCAALLLMSPLSSRRDPPRLIRATTNEHLFILPCCFERLLSSAGIITKATLTRNQRCSILLRFNLSALWCLEKGPSRRKKDHVAIQIVPKKRSFN